MKGYGKKQLRQQGIKVPKGVIVKITDFKTDKLSSSAERNDRNFNSWGDIHRAFQNI